MSHPIVSLLKVQIVRLVDDAQPGWVACEFGDAEGRRHTLIDKVPIFTGVMLDGTSVYPQSGEVACEILGEWKDARGRNIVRISTDRPYGITSNEGLREFVVLSSQLSAS
jgi:hypothetical protein